MVTRARDPGPLAREIEHTADLGLEVEAPTLGVLFERAGLAVLGLVVDLAAVEPRTRVDLAVAADGHEALLHDWLQALLLRLQTDGFALSELAVEEVRTNGLRGWGAGEPLDRARHAIYTEIKGVSYHQLAVRETPRGWWARIILDV
jgi:SHS2 domain-containing protein